MNSTDSTTIKILPRLKRVLGLLFAAVVLMTGPTGARAEDAKAIEGTWIPTKADLGGQPMAEAILKTISLKLESGKYLVLVAGEPDKGTYTLDTTAQPKSMSVVGTEGVNHGRTFPAIYELDGDTLRICYDLSGAKYPTEFKSLPGTKLYLVTYSRKKE